MVPIKSKFLFLDVRVMRALRPLSFPLEMKREWKTQEGCSCILTTEYAYNNKQIQIDLNK